MATPLSKRLRTRQQELGFSDADVARRLGITQRRYNNYAAGHREPPIDIVARLCSILRMDPADILGVKRGDTKDVDDALVRIETLDVQASAGGGSLVEREDVTGHVVFQKEWLRRLTTTPEVKLKVIEVDGDSMSQTLHAGDQVLVDLLQRNPKRDGIYVFEWDGLLNIKRITADPTSQTISITSDNPAYVSRNNISPDQVRVVGRVIWMGRKV
jgi:phage repressor protein C with HTH and peptisase S24 domain